MLHVYGIHRRVLQTASGRSPVREFLDELKQTDPDDFAAVLAGLAKLRNRQYHREPLSKALNDGLFELSCATSAS
jgi:hypothetical protein